MANECGCQRRIKITKRLEELFDLPPSQPEHDDSDVKEEYTPPVEYVSEDTLNALEKIESALPQVRDLTLSDQEMDDIASLAMENSRSLMDLGMQVDSRFASEIFNSSATFMGHAITAKTAKVNKKLKMVQLQLQQAELQRKIAAQDAKLSTSAPTPDVPTGTARVMDRTELLRMLNEKPNN
jgi:hypothetical protein